MVDARDGHEYKTITIGTQEWMAENLSYATKKSACYEDSDANCNEYGRLYSWYEARYACPEGFHLPSLSEFEILTKYVESLDKERKGVGTLLKAKDSKQKETLGFVSVMTGNRSANGEYHNMGSYTRYWTTDRPSPGFSRVIKLDRDSVDVNIGNFVRENYFSVRCLKNYDGWTDYSKTDYDDTYDAFYYAKSFDMVKTVRIGKQVWTAQNVSDKTMSTGVYSMDKKGKSRKECGLFYSFSDAQNVCPKGWRLANKDDFIQLAAQLGVNASQTEENAESDEDEVDDANTLVLDNLASVLYASDGFNLMNCGMVVVQNSSDMANPEKCVKGFCSQQYGMYGGFWGESFDVGTADNSIVLDDYASEDGYRGLLPVRCILEDSI